METIDIWVFPDTPNCQKIAHIIGNDRRARLIDARQFREYLPPELTKVPGFIFKARDGKTYPWQGEDCVKYVQLHFGNPTQNLVGALAGVPVQDVRDRPPQYNQQPPYNPQPQQPQYNQQPQQPQYNRQPQYNPPQQQQQRPATYPPPKTGGFGNHNFSSLMKNQVRGGAVISIDEGRMGIAGTKAPDIMAERARQDAMYLPRR